MDRPIMHDEWTAYWVIWYSMEQTEKDWICDDVECVVFEWEKDERVGEGRHRAMRLLRMNGDPHKRERIDGMWFGGCFYMWCEWNWGWTEFGIWSDDDGSEMTFWIVECVDMLIESWMNLLNWMTTT